MTAVTTRTATVTLPTNEQILITREFDAPRQLVWRAWTEPELIRRWWHANRGEVTSIDVDLRVGGAWRYVMVANGDFEVAFHGEYREIEPQERLVHTEVYEGAPDGEALTSQTFHDLGGDRTLVSMLVQHTSQEHRDMHVNSGMEDGLQDALVLLEGVANSLR
jgi:uncharacterized protein YndB with AHSA1/START domain